MSVHDWSGYVEAKNKTFELIDKATTGNINYEMRKVYAEAAQAAATLALAASRPY